MTYQVTPGSPKAQQAIVFGLELQKACTARDVSFKELERKIGVGHTTIWHYRFGHTLPRMAAAAALAAALDWPKLRELVQQARTRTCRRQGCELTFINDVGSEARKYCSPMCGRIAVNVKQAEYRARSAGQTGSFQTKRAHVQRLRAAVRIADERVALQATAIAAMCRDCEPEGICRTADCPLRLFSPLPLATHAQGAVRTTTSIRVEVGARPELRARRRAAMLAHYADPESYAIAAAKAGVSYPAERRSVVSAAMHARRRCAS